MKSAENENWRKKYFDSLSSIEIEQRQFRTMESTLKRLVGRLCSASLGQSAQLDEQIRKLQAAVRRDATSDDLDLITPALTDAIQSLDHSATIPAAATVNLVAHTPAAIVAEPAKPITASREMTGDDAGVRAILAALLAELRHDTALLREIDALDAKLATPMTRDEFPALLSAVTDLVGQRINRIESARQEVEVLLGHMVGKLDEIGQFVAEQNRSQNQSQASSETLNVQLVDEMKAMGESVEAADDVQQIRTQVRARIASVDRHLEEFRQREVTLVTAMVSRNEQMRSRIVELESRATRLQSQLKDEQRLSTMDALTKVPNRLAYEKRIDEELKRWQRFRQPTCIAVWDVDRFKHINDTYGHRAGDRVLRAVADCLANRIRATDFLARYGGEEFVMILPGTTLEDSMRVLDETRVAVSSIGFHFRGTPLSITISSGVTTVVAGDSAGAAFDRADKALYQAKESGRNRCVSSNG